MSTLQKVIGVIAFVLMGMQAFRPTLNRSAIASPQSLNEVILVPPAVDAVLKKACYDCHSNNTRYPWYTQIEPVGWMLDKHIRKGKSMLNFSVFGSYSSRQQVSKLHGIRNSVREGTMPLPSYAWMHHDAVLSKEDKACLIDWAEKSADSVLTVSEKE